MSTPSNVLEIKDLHVRVAQTDENAEPIDILKGVNLTVRSGETHAIMGPNGSGKSTLSYAIAGHPKYEITSGSITLNGRVLTLAAGSHVVGEVEAGTVIVSGKMDGTIEAKDRLDIKSTADVKGQLSTAKLIVADGSQLNAKVEMPQRKARLAEAS